MQDVILILAAIGALTVYRAAASAYRIMFGNRDGNSGRFGHYWTGE